MAELNFQLGGGKPESKAGKVVSSVILFLFATPFAGFGLFAVCGGINKAREGNVREGIFISLFGLVFAIAGLGLMYAAITAARRQKTTEEKWRAQTDGGSKPWLLRPDWATGRIKSSTDAQWKIMLFMGFIFSAVGISITAFVVPKELQKGNYLALLALIFPLAGIGLLTAAIRGWLAQRRYGECFFELASIPGAIGGTLEGSIQTGARLRLEHGLHLKLSCLRRTVSGSGDNRQTNEEILWQDEKVFKNEANFPESEPGHSSIPVYFKIPASQPECSTHDGILWRLEAKAKVAGPDFISTFDVPVFQVAGIAADAKSDAPDPTAAWQMPVEELRRDENSKIQTRVGSDGHEFYFPAARNVGAAFSLTVAFLAFGGFTVAAWLVFHSLLFEIAFGLVSLLVFIGCFNLWFKSNRITINSSGVTRRNCWLLFTHTRQFDAGEIIRFDTKVGMTSGNQAYQDIVLITRTDEDNFAARKAHYQQTGEHPPLKLSIKNNSGGHTLASSIASKPEADWLVREMTRALGRKI